MQFIKKFPVLSFVSIAVSIQIAIVLVASHILGPEAHHLNENEAAHMVFRFRVFGPVVSVLLVAWALGGSKAWNYLLAPFLKWRAHPKWYVLAFSWKFIAGLIATFAVMLIYGTRPNVIADSFGMRLFSTMPFIVGIAIVEETCWIGFSLTLLQRKYSALLSTQIVGFCWGLWYLPMLLINEGVPPGYPPVVFVGILMALTVLLAWVYNTTRSGTVLLVMQIISNCAFFIIPILPAVTGDPKYITAFFLILVFVAILIWSKYGAKNLSNMESAKWPDNYDLDQ